MNKWKEETVSLQLEQYQRGEGVDYPILISTNFIHVLNVTS